MAERVNPPDLETRFISWVRENNIEAALFDLDDTLINTNINFAKVIHEFLVFCEGCIPSANKEGIKANLDRIDTESFSVMGVHPDKWDFVVGELANFYGHDGFMAGTSILKRVYTQVPELKDGAGEILDVFQRAGLKLGLVTHSTPEWANLKVDTLGIRDYFQAIVVADVTRYKGSEDWKSAIDLLGVDPARVLAVGDNVRGDIEAAYKVGVRHLAWIPSLYHLYNQGDLPDCACEVESLDKLIETLVAC